MGIHIELYNKTKEYLRTLEEKYTDATQQLEEAKNYGDASENSELDAAKENFLYILREIEKCKTILSQPILKAHSTDIIEEGCIISLAMYGPYNTPQLKKISLDTSTDNSSTSMSLFKSVQEKFPLIVNGIFLVGGSAEFHNIIDDKVLDINSPVCNAILGKSSGIFEIAIPAGFSTIVVQKLQNKKGSDTGYELYN